MAQRILAPLLLCCLLIPGMAAAETGKTSATRQQVAAKPQKSPEARYLDGLACLKQSDTACAQVTLAGINPASPYAKILDAQIAANRQDFDTALRLLIPLQAENSLLPQASASLHATLAQAYENQENPLRALEQRCLAGPYLADPADAEANQSRIWEMLASQPREALLEMRGESPATVIQGWIDLALAAAYSEQRGRAIEQWRSAYPDHPATDALLARLAGSALPAATPAAAGLQGKIALLLPLDTPAYSAAAEGLRAGFMAAYAAAHSEVEIQVYPVSGSKDAIASAYQLAVQEGARHIVGPLTREEVGALAASDLVTVTTLALNHADNGANIPQKLLMFGQPVEAEARQVARIGRQYGMQSALVVAADTPLAKRMAETFAAEWKAQDGNISLEVSFSAESDLAELKAQTAAHPADMIFLAANAEEARQVRPYLDQAAPTFGTSHIYDGDASNPLNAALSAIHFVDMPWQIDPTDPEFAPYRQAAGQLPRGEAQRWFAVGVDAWRLLTAAANGSNHSPMRGLTGNIRWENGQPVRELSMAQFRTQGVAAEPLP